MLDDFGTQLNNLLVSTFRSVLKVEEQALKSSGSFDLSISEMHLIEAVGHATDGAASITDIADNLGITTPSVTIAVNKLQKKGYLTKVRSTQDGRVVHVALTDQGKAIDRRHTFFHEQMVLKVSKVFSTEERLVLLKGVSKLNDFFSGLAKEPPSHEL